MIMEHFKFKFLGLLISSDQISKGVYDFCKCYYIFTGRQLIEVLFKLSVFN